MANYKLKYAGEKIDELLTKIDNLGDGTDAKSGTVKLSSATNSNSGVSDGVAATPAAVKAVADAIIDDVNTELETVKQQVANITPDDSTVGEKPWSSKNIVDVLCPPIEESGNPVVCYPVSGYPLGVKAKWEPVQEGSGTPSPENIRPIKGRDSVTVERCGKNLFDIAKVRETHTLTKTDRQITLKTGRGRNYDLFTGTVGLSTNVPIKFLDTLPFLPSGTYKISYDTTVPGTALCIVAVAKDGSVTILSTKTQAGFTLSEGTLISIRCDDIVEVTLSDIQITLGSTAPTEYTPYIGQTNTLTLPETVYGGEVDAVSGDGQKTWKTVNAASLSFIPGSAVAGWNVTSETIPFYTISVGRILDYKAISNKLKYVTDIVTGNTPYAIGALNEYLAIRLPASIGSTSEAVHQWLANNDVQICYKLTARDHFTATGAQPLPALAGLNTVLTDADDVTVTGRADPIKRITDLEDAVASQT